MVSPETHGFLNALSRHRFRCLSWKDILLLCLVQYGLHVATDLVVNDRNAAAESAAVAIVAGAAAAKNNSSATTNLAMVCIMFSL